MIKGFVSPDTKLFWESHGKVKRPFCSFAVPAMRKLRMLDAAMNLHDLRQPPGNHLEPLAADRGGQHSIRINDQYRICFVWTTNGPANVEIVDYH